MAECAGEVGDGGIYGDEEVSLEESICGVCEVKEGGCWVGYIWEGGKDLGIVRGGVFLEADEMDVFDGEEF